jgi:hypothetical protein
MRRALAAMVKNDMVITIGRGGRGDPLRYAINPLLIMATGAPPKWAEELFRARPE